MLYQFILYGLGRYYLKIGGEFLKNFYDKVNTKVFHIVMFLFTLNLARV